MTDIHRVQLAGFTCSLDRMLIAPMLASIALELRASLEQVAVAASVYLLLYGLMQPVWALLSDRLGRVRTMRVALIGTAVGSVASALAVDTLSLAVARGATGAFVGAVIPASLTYIGDSVPPARRQHELVGLMAASTSATAVSFVVGGAVAGLSWRLGFAGMAAMSVLALVHLRQLAEPPRTVSGGIADGLRGFLAQRWAAVVVGIALAEGAIVLGCLTYLAPAVEASGSRPAAAGACIALFGLGNLVAGRVARRFIGKVESGTLIAAGGALLALGWLAAAVDPALIGAGIGATAIGAGFALFHSTLQMWATEVTPEARATTISFFAAALFLGAGVAAAVFGPLADDGAYTEVFAIAAGLALPLAVVAALTRKRYAREVESPLPSGP